MSSVISTEEVARIASLARLGVTDKEITAAAQTLQDVLAHFAAIQDIVVTDVPTADNMAGLTNITRADEARPENLCSAADLRAAAPDTSDNQIKVKAVFT
ncbi:MAG: Asp-tRNA(Asn)/Glu-tRNA(Gln) amidotransferase GatCAB subunit C [Candidatus Andersenbacteria bacterium CG10_big_fil_rev_8_21_14_0_10_54_11]|uniref:Aspartyl/glutamyl-tRNA(Asn/Gln) amidotransferase subunit C n=1 Tax=Candidatus Andersenbacteria bacterium CG10_big_fil_rev_8_21_14_0_10_54_11 TaxID=1974485 RepID=A0A2M6WY97_9BACT|nr:MAG: Asp-tRNA(Asn)/Glu-tRNA(Gln) amidotransferase GatCAB subunit C [Candidatus Andersenbacteria bacterium CG10_big_fil_rev_8_21_14_0_10_54_11]